MKTPAFHRKQSLFLFIQNFEKKKFFLVLELTKLINQGLSQLNSSLKIQTERICPDALSKILFQNK
jgi:hypothetical protein